MNQELNLDQIKRRKREIRKELSRLDTKFFHKEEISESLFKKHSIDKLVVWYERRTLAGLSRSAIKKIPKNIIPRKDGTTLTGVTIVSVWKGDRRIVGVSSCVKSDTFDRTKGWINATIKCVRKMDDKKRERISKSAPFTRLTLLDVGHEHSLVDLPKMGYFPEFLYKDREVPTEG